MKLLVSKHHICLSGRFIPILLEFCHLFCKMFCISHQIYQFYQFNTNAWRSLLTDQIFARTSLDITKYTAPQNCTKLQALRIALSLTWAKSYLRANWHVHFFNSGRYSMLKPTEIVHRSELLCRKAICCTCLWTVETRSVYKKILWLKNCYQNVLQEEQKWDISEECFDAV